MTKDLYTTKDVKEVREILLKEQKGIDPITGLEIPKGQAVLDHDHKTQFVRAVLHRQSNAVLGKIENLWTRYLSYWYTGTLPDFLRGVAAYLEAPKATDYAHPKWIKKCLTEFRKLSASAQNEVLKGLGSDTGKNPAERLKKFNDLCLTRGVGFARIRDVIKQNGGFVN